ncbi:MAG: response regulator [Candidatus Wallbacteria bacterium]|nr:response regulator [Candidatus Wallbacteria bacterium]
MTAEDRYKYFRIEARELLEGLAGGVLALEKGSLDAEGIGRMLRLAHTLKGASRVVRQVTLVERAHAIEDVLAPFREGGKPFGREPIEKVLKLLDEIRAGVQALEPAAAPDGSAQETSSLEEAHRVQTVRVELDDLTGLLEDAFEAGVQATALRRELEPLAQAQRLTASLLELVGGRNARAASRANWAAAQDLARQTADQLERTRLGIAGGVDRIERELADLRARATHLRLLPVSILFGGIERATRDAAQSLGKRVAFHAAGGEVRFDAHVLAGLREALLHAVRNAVAHGLESPAERLAAGKPAEGRVTLTVERNRGMALVVCKDDGRGLDADGIWRAAIERGLAQSGPQQDRSLAELVRLLLQGGISTTPQVSQVSGRGVGLAVVRDNVTRLGGEIGVHSVPGQGTAFELRVPITLASLAALDVEAGGVVASVPLDAVRQVVRLAPTELVETGEGTVVTYEEQAVPFLPLASILGIQRERAVRERPWSAAIVQSGDRLIALGVDRVRGIGSVIVRPIPPTACAEPIVAGASLDAAGSPQLLLDPAALAGIARARAGLPEPPAAAKPFPILVIDDSLTTRMLEQSILETAGYEVHLAVSAEQALEMSQPIRYSLFIVDVEMPGMDGFEFVERARADPKLRDVPCILVTSRASADDRNRGRQAGASAYIVKGEFDQGLLLRKIQELVG